MIPLLALLAFLLFGAGDALTTWICFEKLTGGTELSPVFAPIINEFGTNVFLVLKIAIVLGVIAFVMQYLKACPIYQKAVYAGMILSGTLISISNLFTVINGYTLLWLVDLSYLVAIGPCAIATLYYLFINNKSKAVV